MPFYAIICSTLIGRTARKALLQMSARKRAGELLRRALSALKAFEVMAYTEGYPYFIQEYGRSAWDLKAGKRITLEDTRAAKLLVEADLDENGAATRRSEKLRRQP